MITEPYQTLWLIYVLHGSSCLLMQLFTYLVHIGYFSFSVWLDVLQDEACFLKIKDCIWEILENSAWNITQRHFRHEDRGHNLEHQKIIVLYYPSPAAYHPHLFTYIFYNPVMLWGTGQLNRHLWLIITLRPNSNHGSRRYVNPPVVSKKKSDFDILVFSVYWNNFYKTQLNIRSYAE